MIGLAFLRRLTGRDGAIRPHRVIYDPRDLYPPLKRPAVPARPVSGRRGTVIVDEVFDAPDPTPLRTHDSTSAIDD